ncbi:Hypothetical predicted protein, partial [Paramuricea clavata]
MENNISKKSMLNLENYLPSTSESSNLLKNNYRIDPSGKDQTNRNPTDYLVLKIWRDG